MFFVSLKICEIIKLRKNILANYLAKKYICEKKQTSKIGLCTVLFFFKKTTSNINYNTELKNNYILDKYKKVYLQN